MTDLTQSPCNLKHKMSVWTRYALKRKRTRYGLSIRMQKSNVNLAHDRHHWDA